MGRLKGDFKYIILNSCVNRIPSWHIRRSIYKLFGMRIGKGSRIGIYTVIICPQNIEIGDNTIVNEWCLLDGRGGLIIGNNTSVSMYSKFITASHRINDTNFEYYEDKTIVKDNVWIGANAMILDGSILEYGCVIGAQSCFKGTACELEVWLGNPAKKVKARELNNKYTINYKPYFR